MNGMNVKRFTARTSRDALALVRQAFGDDAVVMSTRPCGEGVEVVAMASESLNQIERVAAGTREAQPERRPEVRRETRAAPDPEARPEARPEAPAQARADLRADLRSEVRDDVRQLEMSTLSFQDYVRDRMLRRRQNELGAPAAAAPEEPARPRPAPIEATRARLAAQQLAQQAGRPAVSPAATLSAPPPVPADRMHDVVRPNASSASAAGAAGAGTAPGVPLREPPVLREEIRLVDAQREAAAAEQAQVLIELRSMRGLIEQRFGALAFMEKLQRQPRQAQLAQRLLEIGFSSALTRKLVDGLPDDVAELSWAASVLERNLTTGERDGALEDQGGVYALIGATGVGKTTSTAKLAAAFAATHGAANLGLITLDAYRVGAQEQLRTYGRILGVPVHTAHDRASLEDLLDLLAGKRMVLIDTAGMAQRDDRTRDLLEMLSHPSIKRLLVLNASAQGETIEDQIAAYAAPGCRGVVLSKVDEAVKLGPALDAVIRTRLKVVAVANGQRVPEDWHRLSASALVQRALKSQGASAWRLEAGEVHLIFAGAPVAASLVAERAGAAPRGL
jgi:flagellar biosynthesis protein FlhF